MKLNKLLEDNSSISSDNLDEDNSSISSGHGCRICTEPVEDEMNFCRCTGYTAIVHKECLLKWLLISNKTQCEICNQKFNLHVSKEYIWRNILCMSAFILVTTSAYLYTFLFTKNNDVSIYILSGLTTVLLVVSAVRNNKQLFLKTIIDIEEYYEQIESDNSSINCRNSVSEDQQDLHLNFHPLILNESINNSPQSRLVSDPSERDRLLE